VDDVDSLPPLAEPGAEDDRRSEATSAPAAKRRPVFLLVAGGLLAVALGFAPSLPRDQTVRFDLGKNAARVCELEVRYAKAPSSGTARRTTPASHEETDWLREATFHYTVGTAPRVITHDLRLPAGEYLLEIEIATDSARTSVERKAMLDGTTSFDLTRAVPAAP
jgi:hypothetical protein